MTVSIVLEVFWCNSVTFNCYSLNPNDPRSPMRFVKKEKLSNEILIKELFEKGSSFYLFPFKVHFLNNPDPNFPFHQVLFSASKRNFKKAVDRNLLKRRMREAFRLNKEALPASTKLLIAYIYTAKEILTFTQIQERLVKTLNRFDHVEKV